MAAQAEGWIVPKIQARVLALPIVARSETLRKMLAHPAGPFTSESARAASRHTTASFAAAAAAAGPSRASASLHSSRGMRSSARAVHFWAPTTKWLITLANISDLYRPVESMSLPQQAAITSTGVIWSYYATQVIPFNTNLLTVNIFMAGTGIWHVSRILQHQWGGRAAPAAVSAAAAAPAPQTPAQQQQHR